MGLVATHKSFTFNRILFTVDLRSAWLAFYVDADLSHVGPSRRRGAVSIKGLLGQDCTTIEPQSKVLALFVPARWSDAPWTSHDTYSMWGWRSHKLQLEALLLNADDDLR